MLVIYQESLHDARSTKCKKGQFVNGVEGENHYCVNHMTPINTQRVQNAYFLNVTACGTCIKHCTS
jgi:hypothetical protein